MKDIFPRIELASKLNAPITFEDYFTNDFDKIYNLKSSSFFSIAMDVWNRIVTRKIISANPQALAKWARNCDPLVYKEIEKLIHKPLFRAIHYTRAFLQDKNLDCPKIVECLVAHVYPNDLHLADILVENPYRPLPTDSQKCSIQTHEGFDLLPTIMNNLKRCGQSLKCDYITLVAAKIENVQLFERFGLKVENNEFARGSILIGQTIPMEMKL
jgi:hypothetical protein